MKSDIHPKYQTIEATCVCGNVIATGSTQAAIKMDICSACHPFFTGTQKLIDTEGRVEKFKKRFAQQQQQPAKKKKSKPSPLLADTAPPQAAPTAVPKKVVEKVDAAIPAEPAASAAETAPAAETPAAPTAEATAPIAETAPASETTEPAAE